MYIGNVNFLHENLLNIWFRFPSRIQILLQLKCNLATFLGAYNKET